MPSRLVHAGSNFSWRMGSPASMQVFADTSTPGTISVDALVDALVKYGSTKISDEQARELVSQLEPDAAGLVRFNEYVDMMMNE